MVRFAVMSDLHTDIIHDAERRLDAFVEDANAHECDFAVQLGDFIQPEFIGSYICAEDRVTAVMRNILAGKGLQGPEKQRLFARLGELNCPLYHVLGNHDLDLYTKEEVMSYWGMKNGYYSFDVNDLHFIVLDANYGREGDRDIPFERGNYMKWYFCPDEPFPMLPKKELEWLERDLAGADRPSVVFCHEGLNGGFLNALNHEEIFDILKKAPRGVLGCFCGHKHETRLESEAGIPVYFVNSISGYSVPAQFARTRFSPDTEERYPNVRYMCVYEDPLYVMVTVDDRGIHVEGKKSRFLPPSPPEVGFDSAGGQIFFSAEALSADLPLRP